MGLPQTDIQHKSGRKMDFEDVAKYIIVAPADKIGKAPMVLKQPEQHWTYPTEKSLRKSHVSVENTIDKEGKYRWRPGFCLQLGSQGRRAMLQLLRSVYKGNKKHKQIFENMNPPTTISNLPFFKVAMLWELAYKFDVFQEALAIHKMYGNVRNKIYRNQHTNMKPYYPNYDATRHSVLRSNNPDNMRSTHFNPDYEHPTAGEERQYAMLTSENVEHLKRNMECMMTVKQGGSDRFMKFMGTFKPRDPNVDASTSSMETHDKNAETRTNKGYEYMPGMNTQIYSCTTMDCTVVPH